MKMIYNNVIPFNGFKAINLFGFLFVRKGCRMSEVDLNHERIHTAQMKEVFYVGFYLWYFVEWVVKLFTYGKNSYRHISFEFEAYENEDNPDYLKDRLIFGWWEYL